MKKPKTMKEVKKEENERKPRDEEVIWMLFDGRYRTNKYTASCYEVCETLKEAKENAVYYGNDTVIVKAVTYRTKIVNTKIIN